MARYLAAAEIWAIRTKIKTGVTISVAKKITTPMRTFPAIGLIAGSYHRDTSS
jgi:hypothetical protein